MSSDGDDVLSVRVSLSDTDFSGFDSGDVADTPMVHKGVSSSEAMVSPTSKRGKSPVKGKKRVKSVVIVPPKKLGVNNSKLSKKNPKPKAKKSPLSRIDIDKLSEQDIFTLRAKLGIHDKENYQYVSDNVDDDFSYVARPNLHVEVDRDDISDTELPGPSRSKDIETQLFGPDSDNEEWQPPKLKMMDKDKAIPKSLANLINTACTTQCDTESIVSKYKVPENVDRAGPPLVNSEVWKILDKKVHSQDRGLSEVQNLVAAAMIPMMKLAETLKGTSVNQSAKTLLSDSLTLLGQVQYNVSVRRRYVIRPHLKKKYFGLCNISTPITTKLFGDDVAKEIKACESASYIGKEAYGQGQYRPAWRGRSNSRQFRRGYGQYSHSQSYGANSQSYGANRYQPYPVQRGSWSRSFRGRSARRGTASGSAPPNDN